MMSMLVGGSKTDRGEVKMSRKELQRDGERGKIGGVCAGLANYFGWEVWLVRIIAVGALLLSSKLTLVAYIAAWIILDKAEPGATRGPVHEQTRNETLADGRTVEVKTRVWEAGQLPREALPELAASFAELDDSVQRMESYVTSEQYRLRQEFNRL